ncbi:MAG: ROK family protein [Candidatus Krumholzibacteria bacterium]|jgi:glucokinase|nr:ROK family protein [Candidatus Krumholzibacteria bacterium]MDP6668959.1 ROK family protein [Candidatus Krumholzibacteria bacterium]MDP6797110.1 ROK family protein [Candidatus Krumholzibacteria bacterium]MDP7022437.1 ROK family protein [Candidatus Krumholzibacteria bacterium]
MASLSLGIDIGGSNVKAVMLDARARPLGRARWKTAALGDRPTEILPALATRIHKLQGRHRLRELGIASAGILQNGRLVDSPNLRHWEGLDYRKLSGLLDCPVLVENDVNALAWAEWKLGAGQGSRNMLCLALGTGIGGGLVLDGKLYRGSRAMGAELGHMTIDLAGRPCACGNRGCLEAYAGARAMEESCRAALETGRRGSLALEKHLAGRHPSPRLLVDAAKKGNRLAVSLLADAGRSLGVALANYVNIFDPEVIVIAGGVSRAGRWILDPAKSEAKRRLMSSAQQHHRLLLRKLGDDGAALGAALLCRES